MAVPRGIVQIADVLVDATTNEDHKRTADVTPYPIEDGSDATDNVHIKPFELSLECVVSDTPLAPIESVRPAGSIPSHDVHARLVELFLARKTIQVVTQLAVYSSVFLTSISEPQNADVGDSLQFTCTFSEAKITTNQHINVRVSLPVAPKLAKGTKPTDQTKPAPEVDKGRVSIIQKLRGH